MGGLEKRIRDLERLYGEATPEQEDTAARDRRFYGFAVPALDAMQRIRRAPIDEEPHRYHVDKLRAAAPITVAAHVAALAVLGHEDEDEAREILDGLERERGLDPGPHEKLIGAFQAMVEHHAS